MPDALYVLVYDYVPDILERRAPHRDAHLDLVRRLHDEGIIVMAGATGDPVDSALVVFRSADDRAVRDVRGRRPVRRGRPGQRASHPAMDDRRALIRPPGWAL